MKLRPFQREFIAAVQSPAYDTVCLSAPRSAGKTALAGHVLARCMTPGDPLNVPGKEYILAAATMDQCRMTYGFIREALEGTKEYRWVNAANRLGAVHLESNTRLRAISSNAKGSFGLVGVPTVVLDEPGALNSVVGGQMLYDSLRTAQGKINSPLKLILIETLAPGATQQGDWWFDLIHGGTVGSTHVQHFRGDVATWDQWSTIRRANPLLMLPEAADLRRKIKEERAAAWKDSRERAAFLSYRLNCPTADESQVLLTVSDWERTLERHVPEREGRPIVAVDLSGGRAWSAATCHYSNGRVEAIAQAPGIPNLEAQERRDRVNPGTYRRLYDQGSLIVSDGLRVPPPAQLIEAIRAKWGKPALLVCDRFKLPHPEDCTGGWPVEPRVSRWSESTFDILSLRRMAKDGPLSIATDSRSLLTASLSAALVANDDGGSSRMVKKSSNNTARDDVAYALHLGAGALARAEGRPKTRWRSRGVV